MLGKPKALVLVCCRVAVAPSLQRAPGNPRHQCWPRLPSASPREGCIACAGLRGRRRVPPSRARPKALRHRCLRPPANGGSRTGLSHAVRVQGEEAARPGTSTKSPCPACPQNREEGSSSRARPPRKPKRARHSTAIDRQRARPQATELLCLNINFHFLI